MQRRATAVVAVVTAVAAGGLGTGLGLGLTGGHARPGAPSTAAARATGAYAYYLSVAKRYAGDYSPGAPMMGGGSMMGWGSGAAATSPAGTASSGSGFPGYTWMMGGSAAPGWMTGGSLPSYMMGANTDMAGVMGRVFAEAPGPRVGAVEAKVLGTQVPSGATADRATNTVDFSGKNVSFAILASPSMPAENFEVGGLTDPTLVVPVGAHVRAELVNADTDMAHGLVVSAPGAATSSMPMMTASPAFAGAGLWFLGEATAAGMHTGTLSFTASTPGTYTYFCPVPGHAQEGMEGTFVVRGSSGPSA